MARTYAQSVSRPPSFRCKRAHSHAGGHDFPRVRLLTDTRDDLETTMRIGVLGTGVVGQTIGRGLIGLGHQVTMGSRKANNENASKWAADAGPGASAGTFADAAANAEIVFNCTAGEVSIEALRQAGAKNLAGKVLVDVSNPLDFSRGFPPTLSVCNTDSIGERIQREFPETKVVKSLNTMTSGVMVNPGLVAGEHDVFVSGNDTAAKSTV